LRQYAIGVTGPCAQNQRSNASIGQGREDAGSLVGSRYLAGPVLAQRHALFDFIVAELRHREHLDPPRIRPVRTALEEQRDDLLAFAGVLDEKLADIAQDCDAPLYLVRDVCLLERKSPSSNAYWRRRNLLHKKLGGKFHRVADAVINAMKQIPRAGSLVEYLNLQLRNYFFLRHQSGASYLNLLHLPRIPASSWASRAADFGGFSPLMGQLFGMIQRLVCLVVTRRTSTPSPSVSL
jgi:hypothetical protein